VDVVRIGMVGARFGAAPHPTFAVQAAEAGKHIIVEKPLTGYFGEPGDPEPIGEMVPRAKMPEGARKNAHAVHDAIRLDVECRSPAGKEDRTWFLR